jgi:hypothetical protein
MTVHPLVAYWVANSSPIPEFAPVIITVAAIAVDGKGAAHDIASQKMRAFNRRVAIIVVTYITQNRPVVADSAQRGEL